MTALSPRKTPPVHYNRHGSTMTPYTTATIDAAVDEALGRRHRGVSRDDARQEAYLAVLEAQAFAVDVGAPEGHLDVAEVARKAVGRLVDRQRRANSGPWPERIPHARIDYGWDEGLPQDLVGVPSAEDVVMEAEEAAYEEAFSELALEELDPTVGRWLRLVLLEGRTTFQAAEEVGISREAARRLQSAAGIREDGSSAGAQARPRRNGLMGLDARGVEPREKLTKPCRRNWKDARTPGRKYAR